MGVLDTAAIDASAGNMEGKEVRSGVINSALWATSTTAASNGSVNAMHDSFTPLGALALLLNMQIGEILFGGVGAGFYSNNGLGLRGLRGGHDKKCWSRSTRIAPPSPSGAPLPPR
jgi:K+-transporting ATPase A subunit